jgi:hypothetical protein
VTEDVRPVPRNIYGVTKIAAEDLCELFHHRRGLACLVLQTSRFFPETDDDPGVRRNYDDANVKVNEYLYRRVDLQDVVDAHLLALERASSIGFRRYIISATTPFQPEDLAELPVNAPEVVKRRIPEYLEEYARRGWRMFPGIDRVYVNERARRELGWRPRYDFRRIVDSLKGGQAPISPLARAVGSKGYHDREFADGPYPRFVGGRSGATSVWTRSAQRASQSGRWASREACSYLLASSGGILCSRPMWEAVIAAPCDLKRTLI